MENVHKTQNICIAKHLVSLEVLEIFIFLFCSSVLSLFIKVWLTYRIILASGV